MVPNLIKIYQISVNSLVDHGSWAYYYLVLGRWDSSSSQKHPLTMRQVKLSNSSSGLAELTKTWSCAVADRDISKMNEHDRMPPIKQESIGNCGVYNI